MELYEVLSDRRSQDRVRAENPGQHCPLLLDNPSACNGCRFNPHEGDEGERIRIAAKYSECVRHIPDLVQEAELGWVGPEDLSPDEVQAIVTYRRSMAQIELEAQAKMIGLHVAGIFSKTGGG